MLYEQPLYTLTLAYLRPFNSLGLTAVLSYLLIRLIIICVPCLLRVQKDMYCCTLYFDLRFYTFFRCHNIFPLVCQSLRLTPCRTSVSNISARTTDSRNWKLLECKQDNHAMLCLVSLCPHTVSRQHGTTVRQCRQIAR